MSSNELICPTHGPYPASKGSCPYCGGSAGRPMPPSPLDEEDNMPTDLGASRSGSERSRSSIPASSEDDTPTDLPRSSRGKRILDMDEDEITNLGRYGRVSDVTEIEYKPTGAEAILWVREGSRRGRIYKIKGDTVIGRKDGDLILDDPKVSNPHAKITCEDGVFTIWDFGSKNGTFVNNERIRMATPLKENDLVKIGDLIFILKVLE